MKKPRFTHPHATSAGCCTCSWGSADGCRGRRYTCTGCLRFVPYCYGAADTHPDLCDDCYAAAVDEEAAA